jgi:DnaJ-class molecular chaperone
MRMFSTKDNHYTTLGVKEDTPHGDIKKAYYKLALKYHPDKDTGNAEKFKAISNAYSVVGNEEKRKRYDRDLKNGGQD